MTQEQFTRMWQSQATDAFAMAAVGVLLYEGKNLQRNAMQGLQNIQNASQAGVLWARDIMLYIMRVGNGDNNLIQNTLVTTQALEQLKSYSDKGNEWATVIMREMLNVGYGSYSTLASNSQNSPSPIPSNNAQVPQDYMKELDGLIGLGRVKQEVASLRNFVIVQKQREQQGLKPASVSYHCVFSGSPGTGKTTVARIVAGIYKDLGILKKGHLVECQRADLVGEYLGQTAPKTNAKIDEALDGVLFIDEAYSLADGRNDDSYGREAIETLLKRMEDDRDRLVVILAGYSQEIQGFIDSNPGLQSRFNRYIHFDDYTAEELQRIFFFNVDKAQYKITQEAYNAVLEKIRQKIAEHDKHFGNARYVRNLFESVIQRQANRVSAIPNPTREQLSIIKVGDIKG